ncbi:hypothetical protein CEXT_25911 [Caerostris extrusa]|uniref:Uncharacterized protein n=1 Tax=Caerostris extrusa TaxID=172846 RepID=A0AAV4M644_CAEEX|nr:hypothetical protein CEXT_25911 [Caerostris extrusa]
MVRNASEPVEQASKEKLEALKEYYMMAERKRYRLGHSFMSDLKTRNCSFGSKSCSNIRLSHFVNIRYALQPHQHDGCLLFGPSSSNHGEKDGPPCNCPLPCTSVHYNEIISKKAYLIPKSSKSYSRKKHFMNDTVRLKIFYSTLKRHVYEQKPKSELHECLALLVMSLDCGLVYP